jgi:hypothetical protein
MNYTKRFFATALLALCVIETTNLTSAHQEKSTTKTADLFAMPYNTKEAALEALGKKITTITTILQTPDLVDQIKSQLRCRAHWPHLSFKDRLYCKHERASLRLNDKIKYLTTFQSLAANIAQECNDILNAIVLAEDERIYIEKQQALASEISNHIAPLFKKA